MTKRKNNGSKPLPIYSHYDLSEVNENILSKNYFINPNATQHAKIDFGWEVFEILAVYKMLQPKHFYKSDVHKYKPGITIDIYKAQLKGENIYTHFYITDKLIINSFHKW
jgi:Motility quorum-sensing regulator, toxin of MqsA